MAFVFLILGDCKRNYLFKMTHFSNCYKIITWKWLILFIYTHWQTLTHGQSKNKDIQLVKSYQKVAVLCPFLLTKDAKRVWLYPLIGNILSESHIKGFHWFYFNIMLVLKLCIGRGHFSVSFCFFVNDIFS